MVDRLNTSKLERAVEDFLVAIGHDTHPETTRTPARVADMWKANLLSGYDGEPLDCLTGRIPDESGATVILKSIPFHGMCPHHLVPYFGYVDLAYEPDGWIVGLGALENLVAMRSRRLVLQEELTGHLIDDLEKALKPKGAACRIDAQHLCLMLRGREPRSTRFETHRATGSLAGQWRLDSSTTGRGENSQ
ncbi:MAG: GTP cyclohydrolase I [Myxococcota bacterium]|nr:GTP cyclohydrolase I [Myxococcota bacterium]